MGCSLAEGEHEHQVCEMQGLVEGPSLDDQGECFSPLVVNATSVNVEVYYNKAVNYTLMVTFVSLPIQFQKPVLLSAGYISHWRLLCNSRFVFREMLACINLSLFLGTIYLFTLHDKFPHFLKVDVLFPIRLYLHIIFLVEILVEIPWQSLLQISFLQVLFLIRQMEHSNTQSVTSIFNMV